MEWYVYGLLSATLFSFYYVILKRNLHHKHVLDYIFIYVSFLALIAAPLYPKVYMHLQPIVFLLMYTDAWMLLLFFITLTSAHKHLEVSEVAPLSNLTTAIVVVIGTVLFSEMLNLHNVLGIFLIIAGAYTLEVGVKLNTLKALLAHLRNRYIKLVLLSSLFASLSVTLDKIILDPNVIGLAVQPTNLYTLHFFTRLFIFVNMAGIMIYRGKGLTGVKHGLSMSGGMIFIATLAYTFANLLYYETMSLQYAALVIPLLSISSLLTTVIGGELFHEHKLPQKIIASIIMIAGVYLVVF